MCGHLEQFCDNSSSFLQTEILYLYALHTYKSNSIVKIWQSIYRKFYLKLPGGNGIAFFHGVLIKYNQFSLVLNTCISFLFKWVRRCKKLLKPSLLWRWPPQT